MISPLYSPWLMKHASKALAKMFGAYIESSIKSDVEYEYKQYKKQTEKEEIKFQREQELYEYKKQHPKCTWMFEHYTLDSDCAINDNYSFKT